MRRFIALCLAFWALAAQAELPSIDYFSQSAQFKHAKIAPDGKHLAVLTTLEGKNVLAIMTTDKLETTYVARFGENKQVGEFHWANSERVIMTLERFRGWWDAPAFYGQWFGVNIDGKKQHYIFGYSAGEKQTGTRVKKQESMAAWGELVDTLPEDEDHVLMKATPYDNGGKGYRYPTLYRLNVYNGRTRKVTRAPTRYADFLVDHGGEVRFVSGMDADGNRELFYRKSSDEDWLQIDHGSDDDGYFHPVAFADDDNLYLFDGRGEDKTGIYKLNLETGEQKLLYRDDQVNPTRALLSHDERELFAIVLDPDYPNYVFIRGKHPSAIMLKNLMGAFQGQEVSVISQTPDGKKAIAMVYSDTDPGAFYLFDAEANSVRHLARRRPWVDPEQSSSVLPIAFEARDGTTIGGYLTLPPGVSREEAKKLPLVVNPHGGPHGVRDYWGYDSESQMLASRGIAVLKVNFRGSEGFGGQFKRAGYRKWGTDIQYDIIDGTRYLVEQGIVDEDRICIYGASFGGYSALQSAIIEPELFQCAVGFVGVYDLGYIHDEPNVKSSASSARYFTKVLGHDEAELKAFSPVYNVDKLKAPVFLIHGEEDEIAPMEHFDRLEAALKAKQHPMKTMVMEKEGHGFYNDDNRKEMYEALLGFLGEHLKL